MCYKPWILLRVSKVYPLGQRQSIKSAPSKHKLQVTKKLGSIQLAQVAQVTGRVALVGDHQKGITVALLKGTASSA